MKSKSDKLLDHFEHESIPNPKFMISVRLKHMCQYQFFNKVTSWRPIMSETIFLYITIIRNSHRKKICA